MTNARRAANRHVDLCIIGSGSGLSLVDDDINDWSIALIDSGTGITSAFGGTCLNAGCIPTKMLAVPARHALDPQHAAKVNATVEFKGIDFAELQARVFGRTDGISRSGLHGLQARENVEVYRSTAEFIDEHTLRAGGQTIWADRIVIAAGSRPKRLEIPGAEDPYIEPFIHTSESIMRLERLPKRMTIIGAGVEAIEFGHIFSALGTKVSILARGEALLRHRDPDISRRITQSMSERVVLRLNQRATGVEVGDEGGVVLTAEDATGIEYSYEADAVLLAAGRVPNGDQLRLDAAGVEVDERGFIVVDNHQRTSVEHIWALGDVCSPTMLKHFANRQAKVVKRNLLAERDGGELVSTDERVLPYGIFGEPEIACVGTKPIGEAVEHIQPFDSTAYGWALNDEGDFVKLVADAGTGELCWAGIVGPNATVLLQPLVTCMQFGIDLRRFATEQYWIHPALSEVVENAVLGLIATLEA